VSRGAKGELIEIGGKNAKSESIMQLRVNQMATPEQLELIRQRLEIVLKDVRLAVDDWQPMRARLDAAIAEVTTGKLPLPVEEVTEVVAFLNWINDDHFTFLGYREYSFVGENDNISYHISDGAGLGVLRDPGVRVFEGMRNLDA